ncbi:protein SLC31A2 isoform X2 [Anarrhichthys ocellatus]|uniref:protein SLC31A2 isoform X2 n=1 Tax=Anarrhichthys ocellatus TaxID=433405 RepID=UPI0012EDE1CF|nr:probable low affinity copper uptake protein 2 isoform X2 [Anarrhichthys ocellatus]
MMSMTFGVSSSVMLLFDFWDVHGPVGMLLSVFVVFLLTVFFELLKLAAAWYPGSPPHAAGVSGLHADAVRHVLQHLDLHRCHHGLSPRLFHLIPSPGSNLMVWTVQRMFIFHFFPPELHALDTKWGNYLIEGGGGGGMKGEFLVC